MQRGIEQTADDSLTHHVENCAMYGAAEISESMDMRWHRSLLHFGVHCHHQVEVEEVEAHLNCRDCGDLQDGKKKEPKMTWPS